MACNIRFLFFGAILLLLFVSACTTPKTPEMQQDHNMEEMMHAPPLVAHGGEQESVEVGQYEMNFDRMPFSTDTENLFTFMIADEDGVVTDLDIMHERPMHVIVVRDDLQYFDHLHPQIDGTFWMIPITFYSPGHYRAWIDFTKDMQQHLIDFNFVVEGTKNQPEPDRLGELTVTSTIPEHIVVGEPTPLQFTVTKGGGKMPITETFLGVAAHLVVIDSTLTEFIHDHDMTLDQDALLSFTPTISQSGLHRAWVQFSVDGKNRIAAFPLSVSEK